MFQCWCRRQHGVRVEPCRWFWGFSITLYPVANRCLMWSNIFGFLCDHGRHQCFDKSQKPVGSYRFASPVIWVLWNWRSHRSCLIYHFLIRNGWLNRSSVSSQCRRRPEKRPVWSNIKLNGMNFPFSDRINQSSQKRFARQTGWTGYSHTKPK